MTESYFPTSATKIFLTLFIETISDAHSLTY